MPHRPRRRTQRWLIAAPIAALIVLNVALLSAPQAWVETVWVRHIWPVWPMFTARLQATTSLPLSLTSIVLLGGFAIACVTALGRPPRARRLGLVTLTSLALLALTFVPAWGVTYRRAPIDATLALPSDAATVTTLLRALDELALRAHRDAPTGGLVGVADDAALAQAVAAAARCVADADAAVSGRRVSVPPRVAALPAGTLLRAGYGGIALPWLLEPHVDAGLPPAARLATATHELTHAAGWAREADTDALAVLAGIACDHVWVRYANALAGVSAVRTALLPLAPTGSDARAHLERVVATLPEAAQLDRAALSAAVARWYRPGVARGVTQVYDAYLRSQGIEAGVADYDASGALIAAALAACDQERSRPWCP